MKKLWLCLVSVLLLASCSDEIPKKETEEIQSRTMLAYLVANNHGYDLDRFLKQNVVDMYYGLSNYPEARTLLVYYRPNTLDDLLDTPSILKFVSDGKGKINGQPALMGSDLTIENVVAQAVPHPYMDAEQVATSPETMNQVIKDMVALAPSKSYGLVFGSHGTGWLKGKSYQTKSFGDDAGYSINIPALAKVLEANFTTNQLDFVLFDACMMASAEVCYELRKATDYCVGSVLETPLDGFPYKDILATMLSNQVDFQQICDAFIAHNEASSTAGWGTCAAMDCSKIEALANWVNQELKADKDLITDDFYRNVMQYGASSFKYNSFDVVDFFRQLKGEVPVELNDLMNEVVVAKNCLAGSEHSFGNLVIEEDRFCGIGMYFPYHVNRTDWDTYYESSIAWYQAVGWNNFRP